MIATMGCTLILTVVVGFILLSTSGVHRVQGQALSECPREATSCCQCVTHPGCVWSPLPSADATQPRCSRDQEFASTVNELVVPHHSNRPFNPHRKRFLRPQSTRLKMSIGLRKEVPVQVLARSRRVRLVVVGPSDYPDFTVEKGDEMSCMRRFRVRERVNARKKQKKLSIECQVSAMGEVQTLHLIVDMTRCFQSKREIKLNVRESGSKKFKLDVTSSCQCPCLYAELPEAERLVTGLQTCAEGEAMTQCATAPAINGGDDETHCSGVNNYCRRNQNEPVCSGRGTCICGVCSCDFIPTQLSSSHNHNTESSSDVRTDVFPADPEVQEERQRYLGAHCQCDDLSCERHHDLLCGGPERGRCRCGHCMCNEGYSGSACEVTTLSEACVGPDGLVCSGLGHCVDGMCECHGQTEGAYCQPCTTCRNDMCGLLAPCVQCFAFEEMETNQAMNCTAMCSSIEEPPISFVLSNDGVSWPETANLCAMRRQDCHYEFAYTAEDTGEIIVNYNTELHCSFP